MSNCCSHGTLLHFGLQSSHLYTCYYHQDLHCRRLHARSPATLQRHRHARLLVGAWHYARVAPTARHEWDAQAPSIFRASWFGRWVVTHSLADSDFHGHRPAVYINQHLLWYLMSVRLGTLAARLVHPTAPVLLTKNGPLGTRCSSTPPQLRRAAPRTHLKFESKLRSFRPQFFQSFALPDTTMSDERQLSWGKLRREPATRWFD